MRVSAFESEVIGTNWKEVEGVLQVRGQLLCRAEVLQYLGVFVYE